MIPPGIATIFTNFKNRFTNTSGVSDHFSDHWFKTLCMFVCLQFIAFSPMASASPVILVLGDSLSAGYGIDPRDGWVSLMKKRLQQSHEEASVVNGSISGDTTAGGLSRLPALLDKTDADIVIVELGGNDGLRGYPLNTMKNNLIQMITLSQNHGAQVLLLGMQIPPNYGQRYSKQFFQVFHDVAEKESVPLVPFFLDGVATNRSLMQSDQIHPTAEAQPQMLEHVWPVLEPLLQEYN